MPKPSEQIEAGTILTWNRKQPIGLPRPVPPRTIIEVDREGKRALFERPNRTRAWMTFKALDYSWAVQA